MHEACACERPLEQAPLFGCELSSDRRAIRILVKGRPPNSASEGEEEIARGIEGELVARARGERVGEPPVVARLMVEIRSDGSRTIARGAIDDVHTGQSVGIEARGETPLGMAFSLARTITRGPAFARTAAQAMRQSVEAQRSEVRVAAPRRASLATRVARRARRILQRR
jgi:hypothetical protein